MPLISERMSVERPSRWRAWRQRMKERAMPRWSAHMYAKIERPLDRDIDGIAAAGFKGIVIPAYIGGARWVEPLIEGVDRAQSHGLDVCIEPYMHNPHAMMIEAFRDACETVTHRLLPNAIIIGGTDAFADAGARGAEHGRASNGPAPCEIILREGLLLTEAPRPGDVDLYTYQVGPATLSKLLERRRVMVELPDRIEVPDQLDALDEVGQTRPERARHFGGLIVPVVLSPNDGRFDYNRPWEQRLMDRPCHW